MALTFGYGNYFFVSWLQTYLVHARNFSERDLLFSALPFVFGACANVAGGITSDAIFKRKGLKAARRWVGISGLGCGAVFALLAALSYSKLGTLLLLSLSFAGICFDQSVNFPTCVDVAPKSPGAMGGALNTAAYVGGSLSGIVFGYVANLSGSYDRPLIIMALVLGIGALLWLKIDPTRQLAFETTLEPSLPMKTAIHPRTGAR